jgi:hypothetical protein
MLLVLVAFLLLMSTAADAASGEIYRITSKDGDKIVTYEVVGMCPPSTGV